MPASWRRLLAAACALAVAAPEPVFAAAGRSLALGASRLGVVAPVPTLPALPPTFLTTPPLGASLSLAPAVGAAGTTSAATPAGPAASGALPLIEALSAQSERLENLTGPQADSLPAETAADQGRRLMELEPPRPGAVEAASAGEPAGAGRSGGISSAAAAPTPGDSSQPPPPEPKGPSRARRAARLLGRVSGARALWSLLRYGVVEKRVDELLDAGRPAAQRAEAARALARHSQPETIEALAAAGAGDRDAAVRQAAREALTSVGQEWAGTLMRQAKLHPIAGRRVSAVRALGALAVFDSSPALVESLADKAAIDIDPEVRLFAVEALGAAASPKALTALRQIRATATRAEQISALEMTIALAEKRQAAQGLSLAAYRPPEGEFSGGKAPMHHGALKRVIVISAFFTAIELVGSFFTGSLSLKADAMHLAADLAINAGALVAVWMSRRPPNSRRTYGYLKLESVMGLASAGLIAVMGIYTGYEAVGRLFNPQAVPGLETMALACAGLASNAISTLLLYRYRDESLSLKGAFLHAATDAVGSVGIIIAGLLIWAFGWLIADPIISVMIVCLILHTTLDLAKRSWNVIMDSVPASIDLDVLEREILGLPGVVSVYDLHVWALNSTELVATVSLFLKPGVAPEPALAAVKAALARRGIGHSTVQIQTMP